MRLTFHSFLTTNRGSRVMRAYPDVEITVGNLCIIHRGTTTDPHQKTRHTYEISYKFEWSTCAALAPMRHSTHVEQDVTTALRCSHPLVVPGPG